MKQTISFQLDKSLVDRLKQEAELQFLSTSALLRLILLKHFNSKQINTFDNKDET
jgi:hypothetical protein